MKSYEADEAPLTDSDIARIRKAAQGKLPEGRVISSRSIIEHTTPVGGNVFADLGFPPEEAARLLAETDKDIEHGSANVYADIGMPNAE